MELKKFAAFVSAAVMLVSGSIFNDDLLNVSSQAEDMGSYSQSGETKGENTDVKSLSKPAVVRPKAVYTVIGVHGKGVKLRWKKSPNCVGYRIYTFKNGRWVLSKRLSAKSTSYSYKKLRNGKYSFQVRVVAKGADGKKYESTGNMTKRVLIGKKSRVLPSGNSAGSTPVARHGRLSVKGSHIVDCHGKVFKIKGMSTHGIMWENFGDVLSYNSLKTLRDDWKINAVRIAMYTEEYGGYTTSSAFAAKAKRKVMTGVENARKLGLYVIIDWHILKDNNPNKHKAKAISFFKEMAGKYKNYNNVIMEICNEPNGGVTWSGSIKPYCKSVVKAIRSKGFKGIIVCGTGTWSQDIDKVVNNRLIDKNCVYTLHFYANTHTSWLRSRLKSCYNKGLPVLVTEFGTCDASGNGGFNAAQSKAWFKLLDSLKVGYVNWSLANKSETASAFKSGTKLNKIKSGTSQLTASGKLVRAWFRAH